MSGRIHPAKISCLNALNRTVTVEWVENGETKAKEVRHIFGLSPLKLFGKHVTCFFKSQIEIETIFSLNPHLLVGPPPSEGTPPSRALPTVSFSFLFLTFQDNY